MPGRKDKDVYAIKRQQPNRRSIEISEGNVRDAPRMKGDNAPPLPLRRDQHVGLREVEGTVDHGRKLLDLRQSECVQQARCAQQLLQAGALIEAHRPSDARKPTKIEQHFAEEKPASEA